MGLESKDVPSRGIRFSIGNGAGEEIARAYLYLGWNDLHPDEPFGLLEDVFVTEPHRGKGIGSRLVQQVIAAARTQRCYKLIATSRHGRAEVHQLYRRLGFEEWGKEFRIDFR